MTTLKIGDKAPAINANDQDGNLVSLANYKGKKIIIYFYPKDDTPGCTAQACNLRDNYTQLLKQGFIVLGISADNETKHKKFIEKYSLPFPLIADVNKDVVTAYGVWGEKKFLGKTYDGIHRVTFVINEKGIIEEIIEKVETKKHTEQILELLKHKS